MTYRSSAWTIASTAERNCRTRPPTLLEPTVRIAASVLDARNPFSMFDDPQHRADAFGVELAAVAKLRSPLSIGDAFYVLFCSLPAR